MKLIPKWEFLILKREIKEKIGSILLPDDAQKRLLDNTGIVDSVGPEAADWVQELVDQEIVYKQYGGNWQTVDGVEFYTIHQDDIIAVLER
jgi:co-chaperonin GroES (HSP10)